jgi:hypothetical protein
VQRLLGSAVFGLALLAVVGIRAGFSEASASYATASSGLSAQPAPDLEWPAAFVGATSVTATVQMRLVTNANRHLRPNDRVLAVTRSAHAAVSSITRPRSFPLLI